MVICYRVLLNDLLLYTTTNVYGPKSSPLDCMQNRETVDEKYISKETEQPLCFTTDSTNIFTDKIFSKRVDD